MVGEKIREGYKKTEVGVIPEDWEVYRTEDCMIIETGNKNTKDNIKNGFYPFFVRSQDIERINSYSYNTEAVLTAGDGVGTGKVFHYIVGKFDVHQRVYVMYNFNRVFGKYYYYYFSNNFLDEVNKFTAKSSVDSVRRDMIIKMSLPVPPLKEQKAIAQVLSDTDELINSLEKLIEKKEKIKKGTMQKLLTGEERLAGFHGEWEEKTVGEIGHIGRGRVISKKEMEISKSKKYPVYSSQTTNNGVMGFIDTYDFEGNYITWTTDGANAGKVFYRNNKFNCTNVCGTIKLTKDNYRFIALAIDINTKKYVSTNLANPKLMNNTMKSVKLLIPPLEEQKAIAQILSDMDAEIEALNKKLDKYKKIKQGMMEELLTGRIRLV